MMQEEWSELITRLAERQPFVYVHNRGNAGDQLIYKGMDALFRQAGLLYEERSENADLEGAHVVFSGGGNLTPFYDRCRRLIESRGHSFASFTLLPHTVGGHESLLRTLDKRFHIFCRDRLSFEHCHRHLPAGVGLSQAPDLALAVPVRDGAYRSGAGGWLPFAGIDRQFKWRRKWREAFDYVEGGGTAFFRTDKETPDSPRPERNLDLSALLSAVQKRPAQRIRIANTMLAVLDRAPHIATDRLHVAIAGALLGKPTRLFAGNNPKNQAVFAQSLKDRFPKVRFAGELDASRSDALTFE